MPKQKKIRENTENKTRTCFNCEGFFWFCILSTTIENTLRQYGFINIDNPAYHSKWEDIFKTLAEACTRYKEHKYAKKEKTY